MTQPTTEPMFRSISFGRAHLATASVLVFVIGFALAYLGDLLLSPLTVGDVLPFALAVVLLYCVAARPLKGQASAHVRELRGLVKRTVPVTVAGILVALALTLGFPKGSLEGNPAAVGAISALVVTALTLPCWAFVYHTTVILLARWSWWRLRHDNA